MGLAEKIGVGIVGVAFATTLFLPDRTTVQALKVMWDGFGGALSRAMGR